MLKRVIKYVRFEDKQLIITPTAEGREVVAKKLGGLKPLVDKIGGVEVAAFVIETPSPIKFFKEEINLTDNTHNIHVFTVNSQKAKWQFPATVKVEDKKEEEPKK